MCTYNIEIQHNAWSTPLLWQNNVYIMEAIQELGLANSQLEQINAWQMHLQITTLTKMTDHTSSTILPQVLNHNQNTAPKGLRTISMSLLIWPNIHQLSLASWFAGALSNTKLTHPLGTLTANYQKQQHWHWCLAPTGGL